MNETKKSRGWVKDAAIIFLVILLVLTFFSKTIMDWSLPEVAVQYVSGGAITAQIRGTAPVKATETYEVTLEESRKVKTVYAKAEQEVNVGDVLLVLSEEASDELNEAQEALEQAKDQLESMKRSYQRDLLSAASGGDYSSQNREIDKLSEEIEEKTAQRDAQELSAEALKADAENIAALEEAVAAAEAAYEEAEAKVEELNDQLEDTDYKDDWTSEDITAAQEAVAKAEEAVKTAQTAVDAASAEAKAAETELKEARLDQKTAQERVDEQSETVTQLQDELAGMSAGNPGSDTSYAYNELQNARKELESAKEGVTAAQKELEEVRKFYEKEDNLVELAAMKWASDGAYTPVADIDAMTPEDQAQIKTQFEAKGNTETILSIYRDKVVEEIKTSDTEVYDAYAEIQKKIDAVTAAEDGVRSAEDTVASRESAYQSALDNDGYEPASPNYNKVKKELETARTDLKNLQKPLNDKKKVTEEKETAVAEKTEALTEANEELGSAKQELAEAQAALEKANSDAVSGEKHDLQREIKDANRTKEAAQKTLDEAKAAADEAKKALQDKKDQIEALRSDISALQDRLEDAVFALSQQKKTDNQNQAIQELGFEETRANIAKQEEAVEKAQERVNKLSGKDGTGGTEIRSEVHGVVKTVSVTSGNKAEPKTPLITIEVPDRGYSAEMSVTAEQAQRVQVGDYAQVSTGWWRTVDISARLAAVRNDPQNPRTNRLLVFEITGADARSGDNLTLSIGERSRNFETVVPKSAIRSDTNGDFVLIVEAKQSPVGNRYTARRVDVNKVAEDDVNAAVTGGLSANDCIITTSSAPIEAGMQVRMAE